MGTIMNVYYGSDNLPYKDSARTVHYPIVGNSFTGASLVDEIRFYIDRIGSVAENTFVAIAKRADGKKGYKILDSETDETINESYVSLQLSQWFTAKQGDLYISLNVYKGGVETEVDPETNLNIISGIPIIQVTGSIKLSINYTPMMNENYGEVPMISVQDALGLITNKADIEYVNQTLKKYVKDVEVTSIKTAQEVFDEVGGDNHIFSFDLLGIKSIAMFVESDTDTYDLEIWNENGTRVVSPIDLTQLFRTELDNAVIQKAYLPIVELTTAMQTLTAEELKILEQDNSVIKYSGRLYAKSNETTNAYEYVSADYDIAEVGDNNQITKYEISVNKTTGATNMITSYVSFYSSGEIDTKLEEYAKVDGNYPTMTVGNADALTPYGENSGANDTTPFVFQSTGGSSDVGVQAYLKALRGNSVAWNQLQNNGNFATSSGWTADNGTISVSNNVATATWNGTAGNFRIRGNANSTKYQVLKNHTYLVRGKIKCNKALSNVYVSMSLVGKDFGEKVNSLPANTWFNFAAIYTMPSTITEQIQSPSIGFGTGITNQNPSTFLESGDTISLSEYQTIDLTLMFGAGNEPESVLEFNRLFPKPYYAYNAGELLSCKVNGYKTVGYNQLSLDRTAGTLTQGRVEPRQFEEDKYYVGITQDNYSNPNNVSSFSITSSSITITSTMGEYGVGFPIKVVAGQTYTLERTSSNSNDTGYYVSWYDKEGNYISNSENYTGLFTAPNNAYWCVIILRPLVNVSTTYTNICFHLTWDGSRTGYEPYESETYPLPNVELRSARSAYDELKPDGTLIRRIGYIDLGTLSWQKETYTYNGNSCFRFKVLIPDIVISKNSNVVGNILCSKYQTDTAKNSYINAVDKIISLDSNHYVDVYDTAYSGSDATAFKSAMSGVLLYYELAEPTEETVTGYQEITPIDDWGTQEFLYDDTIDIPVPQGNEFFYPVDYKAFIDSLGGRDDIEYDATKVVSQTQLANYLKTISGYDATKTQTLKNVNGTFTWVDD